MSGQAEANMWSKFRKIDTQRQQLVTSLKEMEDQEAFACEKADRVEK
jgi:hypothetical protein